MKTGGPYTPSFGMYAGISKPLFDVAKLFMIADVIKIRCLRHPARWHFLSLT
jgi:hypothetical protein